MLTAEEMDLIRWCYTVAGFSRTELVRDFECSIEEIERALFQPKRVVEFGAPLPPGPPLKPDREFCNRVLAKVLLDTSL